MTKKRTYKKKNSKKRSNKKISFLDIVYGFFGKFFDKKPLLAYASLTVALMLLVFSMEQGAQWFKASLVEIPKFDGTVMPIKQIPNWSKTGGANSKTFTDYSPNELTAFPKYDIGQLSGNREDVDTINAKMTYSVVYMGNYKLDHKEGVGSHLAVDIKIPVGTPVFAVANGVVSKVKYSNSGFGNHLCIKHTDAPVNGKLETLYSCYSHMGKLFTEEGKPVKKGDQIGLSGNSGTSTTPHLHFQIDRDTAPWHPWWPFSSAEVAAAGLDFFSAINSGFNKAEAKKNTIHPMQWVQEHLSGNGFAEDIDNTNEVNNSTNEDKDDNQEEIAELEKFEITANEDEFEIGDEVTITIMALDKDNKIIEEFTGEDTDFMSTDKSIDLPNLNFDDGMAEVEIDLESKGEKAFIVKEGRILATVKIMVEDQENEIEEEEENEETVEEEEEVEINSDQEEEEEEVETEEIDETDENLPVFIKIEGEGVMNLDDDLVLTFKALDGNEDLMTDLDFDDLDLKVDGKGKFNPESLSSEDFIDGIVEVKFTSDKKGRHAVYLEGYKDDKFLIEAIDGFNNVSEFDIEIDGNLNLDIPSEVKISTLDSEGEFTPKSFRGTVELSLLNGKGEFSKDELSPKDFENGIAEITFTPTKAEYVQIKAHSGMLYGESKKASVIELIGFTDVKDNDEYAEAILALKEDGIIDGFSDGTFKPTAGITRVATLKMILNGLDIDIEEGEIDFKDTENNQWYRDFLFTAVENEVINGFPDNTFRPADNITRDAFFKIVLEAANVDLDDDLSRDPFSDVPKEEWFSKYAKFAKENDLLDFKNDKFEPLKEMSRGEVAEVMYRLQEL